MLRSTLLGTLVLVLVSCSSTEKINDSAGPEGTIVVANMSGDTVMLVDAASGLIHETIPSGPAPHEVAVSPDGGLAVVTNYGDQGRRGNTLTVIDLGGDSAPRTIDLGIYERPHGIVFMPNGEQVAVSSEVSGAVVFVDVASGDVVATAETKQRASHMVAAGADSDLLFTTNIVDGSITQVDATAREFDRIISVGTMVEGIAVAPGGKEIWVGANQDKKVLVVDAGSGDIIGSLEDFGFPYRMAFTSDGNTVLISDPQKGEVRIVDSRTRLLKHLVTFDASDVVATAEFPGATAPEGIAPDRASKYAFVSMQGLNKVACVRVADGVVVAYYEVGEWPDGIGYSPLTL